MAVRILFALCLFLLSAVPSRADKLDLPGLQNDSEAYVVGLMKRFPAGVTPLAKRTAEQQAAAAMAKQDWIAAATALETRIAQGDATAKQYLDLATAQMKRVPPEPRKALFAAWMSFYHSQAGDAEIPPLLLLADVLHALDRDPQMVQVLQAVVDRAPNNAAYQKTLKDAQRAVGVTVKKLRTETDADPPRVCVEFTVPPVRRSDFAPGDWVRLAPPVPDAAVTRENDQICVSGLPPGTTTKITLRAGMPGEGGLTLVKETTLPVAVPNLPPRIIFDTRVFVLPRGQTPSATMTTVNLSSVSLRLIRLTERNVVTHLRDTKLGEAIEAWKANNLAEQSGREVWSGTADIPKWQSNKPARTALPFPDALASAGPGLYLLIAAPGDGTSKDDDNSAVQMILRTDLAPTVWRGSDGLTVQVRGYSDAKPRGEVRLALLAHNNDILAETKTDGQGFARFPRPLLLGEGPLAPAALHAFGADDDFAALDLNVASFDLSDRGVEGMPHPGPLDAFVWLDRGIYRPGETVQVMAMLRDAAGLPADIPATVTIKRPNGQVFMRTTPSRTGDASLYSPVVLSSGAAVGTWHVEVNADPKAPPIGSTDFRVDAFVPDRMAVEAGPLPPILIPGQTASVPVSARFLYGAPASGLTGKGKLRLVMDPDPFPALSGYRIGLVTETYAPDSLDLEMPDTDAAGHTTLPVTIDKAPDVTRPLKAEIDIEVDDPSGRTSRANVSIPVRPSGPSIGIKPLFPENAVDAQAEAAFDVAAVTRDGARTAMVAKLRLVRERPDWRIVTRGSLARYETVWKDEPLETRDVSIPEGQPFHFAKRLDFGRYRIEVAQTGGMAITSYRFRSGWATSDSPDVPDRVDVSADRKVVPVGQSVRIHIAPPFAGEATLLVLSDKVLMSRTLSVPEGGTTVDVPVEASWGPGAYAAVHVFRGGAGSRPGRALGLTWVGVDPAARTIAVSIDVPDKTLPRSRLRVPVKAAPGAWLTMAVVDEGILRLTRFASPDPAAHFLARRRLGLDIRDDWGRLIAPGEGEATLLKQGGDDDGTPLPDIPVRTVTWFSPPVQAGADGTATVTVDLPDFNGQVRLMAVAWLGSRIGAANADLVVRDPMIVEPLLPRFLAPGDDARLSVLLHNIDLPAGEAKAVISTEGPLALNGVDTVSAVLEPGQRAVPGTILHATGAGRGVVKLSITGPGGFSLLRDTAITVRPSRGLGSIVTTQELAPGVDARISPATDRFIPGTWRASALFGGPVRYDAAGIVEALAHYPWSCLEQTTSRGFPMAMLPDGPMAGEDRAGRLQAAVASVLDRQRFDGGFALWSAAGDAEPWLTPYAMDFLLRAKAAGAVVPDQAMVDALKFLGDAADEENDKPEAKAAQAYRLYVLARAGKGRPGAARILYEGLDGLPTPLAKAQLGAALMLAHDQPRAEAAFTAALAAPARKWWYKDYGTALRDQLATVVLLRESGLLPTRLTALTAALPGSDLRSDSLSTQEEAWAVAAAAVLGKDGQPAKIRLDGHDLPAGTPIAATLNGPATVRNLGDRSVWESVSVTGVPLEAPPAARSGMRVSRKFLHDDGTPLDLDTLRQNNSFVLLLEGRAEDGQDHRALVVQGLPAGWEIVGRFNEGEVPGMAWLDKLSAAEAQPAADDRYAAIIALESGAPSFRVAVRLRAVTPGEFELPGAELSDMYRPGVFAHQAVARIKVLAAEWSGLPRVMRALGCVCLAVLVSLGAAVVLDRVFPPNLSRLATTGTEIVDRSGKTVALFPAPGGTWRFRASTDDVAPVLLDTLVATEDRHFWHHPGVNPLSLLRASVQDLRAGRIVSGGSTLTMQAARLLEPRPRMVRSKLIEIARALQLEWHFSKREILGIWLTLAPYGGNLEGVRAGAMAWFGASARNLDAAQSALLVGIPRRPEALRPDRHPDAARAVRDRILAADVGEVPQSRLPFPRHARQAVAAMAGPERVMTTIDLPLQFALERLATEQSRRLPERASLALLVVDARTRAIRAIVSGGEGANEAKAGTLDLTRAVRSPGSAMKPFIYAMAFEAGTAGPETRVEDLPRHFGTYAPEDFDRGFAGGVTAGEALRRSLNLPAVALLEQIGPANFAARLKLAGAALHLPAGAAPSLPLALGGAGITLRDLTGLYAALATDGSAGTPRMLPELLGPGGPFLQTRAAETIAAVLTQPFPDSSVPGAAWKTGTSWGGRDVWALGFNRDTVAGVWVGRPDGTPLPGATGRKLALPLLARVFEMLPSAPRDAPVAVRRPFTAAAQASNALRLLFPPPDAVVSGDGPVTLRAMGGQRPLTFLVNGAPLHTDPARRDVSWVPPGAGFYRLTVLDTDGGVARVQVRVR